jgi:hypothetical protein
MRVPADKESAYTDIHQDIFTVPVMCGVQFCLHWIRYMTNMEHNPFDRMAILLKGLEVYPPYNGFELLRQHSH